MLTDFAGSYVAYRHWVNTILGTHRRRIVVTLTDLDHQPIADLTDRFMTGEVTYDVERQPTRIATLELFDPSRSLQFEPDSPGSVPLHFSRMLRVGYSVYVPALQRWVTCPVITGPITDFDRTGVVARVVVDGKETLALGEAGRSRVYPKKTPKRAVLRGLLNEAGESRIDLGGNDNDRTSIPEPVTVRSADAWWSKARSVAASMDDHLFYNGRGVATARPISGRPAFTFDARTLASEVSFDRDPSGIRNRWIITGAKPRAKKKRIAVDLRLPESHPLSGQSLGREVNGVKKPRWLIERVENAAVKTTAEALRKARRLRDDALRMPTTYTFDSLPIPHLEELDMVRVLTDEGAFVLRMRQWTLPLGLDDAPVMAVGSKRRTGATRPPALGARRRLQVAAARVRGLR